MKCDHILFPIDFSDHSQALAHEAAWIANRFNSRVSLLHVIDIPSTCCAATAAYYDWDTYPMLADKIRRQLSGFPINVPPSRVTRAAFEGEPAQAIVKWATQHNVDLIVMGTHGCGTMRGLLLGSVAQKVIQDAHCPVWINSTVHPTMKSPETEIRHIVCALELSDEAEPVLRFTNELAEKMGAKVLLVHAVPDLQVTAERYFSTNLHDYLMQAASKAIANLQQKAGTDFPLVLTGESISTAIVDAVREQKADLVIIGRGKSQLALGRLRTHAYEIIRQTPCPVLSYSCAATAEVRVPVPAEHHAMTA